MQTCEYKATRNDNLMIHIQSMHEWKTFRCKLSEYKSNQEMIVSRDTYSQYTIHEGNTFNINIVIINPYMRSIGQIWSQNLTWFDLNFHNDRTNKIFAIYMTKIQKWKQERCVAITFFMSNLRIRSPAL